MDDIERAAKVIGVPLMEYVYMPHITMDKNNIVVTKERVPVGYMPVKRTQQTVMKKNGISTGIDTRSPLTGQVTGADKNGRQSDLENAMLVSLGMVSFKDLRGKKSNKTAVILAVISMLFASGVGIVQKIFAAMYGKQGQNEFIFLAFMFIKIVVK